MNKLVVILYGSTGDLVAKKILPALEQITEWEQWKDSMAILALGRRSFDTLSYLEHVQNLGGVTHSEKLKNNLAYLNMDIMEQHDYFVLKNVLKDLSDTSTVFLHFFALASSLVGTVSAHLTASGIMNKQSANHHLLVEKPFGFNQKSAKQMKKQLWKFFDEKQIYRMDHYLGKDVVEQIFDTRFSNPLTKPLFELPIKHIGLLALEKEGIGNRGEYYDKAGATADMVQSHLLQLVSLLTMKKPKCNLCDDLLASKMAALKKIKPNKNSIFGQYKGYTNEKNVSKKSNTETMVYCSCHVGKTPIYLLTGKGMDKKQTAIFVEFENGQNITFDLNANIISLDGQTIFEGTQGSPYAKLLAQAAEGDKRNFVRFDQIGASWAIVDKLLKNKKSVFIYQNNADVLGVLPDEERILFENWIK